MSWAFPVSERMKQQMLPTPAPKIEALLAAAFTATGPEEEAEIAQFDKAHLD